MIDDNTTIEFIDVKKEKKENKRVHKNNLRDFLDGSLMTRELVIKNFRYLILLTILGVVLIANRYHAEKIVRESNKTQQIIKELRSESITVSSKLMEISRQSSVVKLVKEKKLELEELKEPVKKIIID